MSLSSIAGRLREVAFTDLSSAVAGTAIDISDLVDCTYGIGGTFVGTWKLYCSFDGGTTYVQFATGTASGTAAIPRCGHVRLDCSAYTSGTISGGVAGTDPNRAP